MIKNDDGWIRTVSGKEIKLNRPTPIVSDIDVVPYKRKMDPEIAVTALIEGDYVLIVDFYSSGLAVLNALKKELQNKYKSETFQGQRDFRSAFREFSHRLLLLISNQKLVVRKSPEIGWFKIIYDDLDEFLLPFSQVQGLNSAWQWYQKGISIPVLNQKIHPFFGTYFPTRFEHLVLFDNWLKKYQGEKKTAIDIGIGSGVLTHQLLKHGFNKIIGTDTNPNAIIGIHESLKNHSPQVNVDLFYGDLFANCHEKTELIVFNPPWIPAAHNIDGIDKAIYYDETLFPNFFAEAEKHLQPEGRLVLLFSNLAEITKASQTNPIQEELSKENRFVKETLIQANVAKASKNTRRNQNWRASEKVELWVLKLKH